MSVGLLHLIRFVRPDENVLGYPNLLDVPATMAVSPLVSTPSDATTGNAPFLRADLPDLNEGAGSIDLPFPCSPELDLNAFVSMSKTVSPPDIDPSTERISGLKHTDPERALWKFYCDNFKPSLSFIASYASYEKQFRRTVGSPGPKNIKAKRGQFSCPFDGEVFTRKQNLRRESACRSASSFN